MNSPLERHEVRLRGPRGTVRARGAGHLPRQGGFLGRSTDPWKGGCRARSLGMTIRRAIGIPPVHGTVREGGLREFPAANSFAPARAPTFRLGLLARRVIDWSAAPRPTSLRHDAAEAILVGFWGALHVGLLAHVPPELRR
jgi:hypothetical protein